MSASKVLNMSLRGNKAIWEAETFGEQMIDGTVGDLLDRQAEAAPDKEALVYRYPEIGLNLRLTYAGMRDEANRVARGLMALGIRLGDHVALLASNLPEWILLEMALAKIGAVLVTVNTNFRQAELEYVLGQADVHTLVLMDEYRGNDYVRSLKALLPELDGVTDPVTETVTSARFPTFRRAVLLGERQHPGLLPFSRLLELSVVVSDEALAERQAAVTPRLSDPVHERDHGRAERRHHHAPRHDQQRPVRRPARAIWRRRPVAECDAALPHRGQRRRPAVDARQRRHRRQGDRL